MKEYLSSKEQVLSDLSAGEQGLSSQEASSRLSQYGPNKLAEGKQTTLLQRFLSQLADPMIIILIVAAVITPPDVTSQVLVAIPLMILFYASIILCKILFRRKLAEQEEDLD